MENLAQSSELFAKQQVKDYSVIHPPRDSVIIFMLKV